MAIVLARADNRLVHGQVLEAWVPQLGVDTILVVDRELGHDPLQKMVIEGLGRGGLRVRIVEPEQAADLLAGVLRGNSVMLLFAGLRQAVEARDAGVEFERLNLGNIHPRHGSRSLTLSVYLTPDDENLLRHLRARDVGLEARAVPSDRSPDLVAWLSRHPR